MTEEIKKIVEDLTKDCTQEDKAKIFQFVTPGEPGEPKSRVKMEYTEEEYNRLKPILDRILAAIDKEIGQLEEILKTRYEEPKRARSKSPGRNRKGIKAAADDKKGATKI